MSVEVYSTSFAVKQSTDGIELEDVESGRYDEPGIVFNEFPRARFTTPDPSGWLAQSVFRNGKEFQIRRGVNGKRVGELRFPGITEDYESVEDANGVHLTVYGVHKGYKLLQQHLCDTYDYDEDGDASTTRDGVTVNPWAPFIFRKPGGTLDARGEPLPLDGIKFSEYVKCLIGTKFIFQMDFADNRFFRASQIYATTNKIQVYRDGPSSDLRPYLQRLRNSTTGFMAGSTIDTIPLMNGSQNIEKMGDITAVTVTLIGLAVASQDPEVAVSRNGRSSTPTYSSYKTAAAANILHDDAVTDSGFDKWTFTFASGDLPATSDKDALALRIKFAGSDGDASTTKIAYIKVECTTNSDTGLSEGTIDAYDNAVSLRSDIDPSDWIDTDFSEMNRLEAGEQLRKLTESDAAVNTSPHWDLWIDSNLAIHFKERRGSDVTNHDYSFPNANLRKVSQTFVGSELAYQTVAYGAGSGTAQTRIVSKEEFVSGGLYDANRDPATPGALYDNAPRVMRFVDENERSATALFRKARAYHKLHRDPIENIRIDIEPEFIRYFDVGDAITIKNVKTRTSGLKRVVKLSRAWDSNEMEKLGVELGNPLDDLGRTLSNQRVNHETLTIRPGQASSTMGVSGDGVHFSKDFYGVYAFAIHEGAAIERVFLKLTTVPWQITARGAASGGGQTSSSGGGQTTSSGGGQTTSTVSNSSTNRLVVGHITGTTAPATFAKHRVWLGAAAAAPRVGLWVDVVTDPAEDPGDGTDVKSSVEEGLLSHAHTVDNHTHTVSDHTHMVSDHVHAPEFGIWQYDGDSGNGNGNPLYGSLIQLAVDPTVNAQGLPSTFSTEKHPIVFGSTTAPVTEEIDITGYLDVDANGLIKTGEHKVYFLTSAAAANNAKGLACVMVTPVFRLRRPA